MRERLVLVVCYGVRWWFGEREVGVGGVLWCDMVDWSGRGWCWWCVMVIHGDLGRERLVLVVCYGVIWCLGRKRLVLVVCFGVTW